MTTWIRNRKVTTKLLVLTGTLLLGALTIGIAGLTELSKVNGQARSIYADGAVPLQHLAEARDANGSMRQRVLLHLVATPEGKVQREAQIKEFDATVDKEIAELRKEGVSNKELQAYVTATTDYRAFRDGTILPASNRGETDIQPILKRCDELFLKVVQAGQELSASQVAMVKKTADAATAASHRGRTIVLAMLALSAALGIGLAVVVSRALVDPIRKVSDVLGRLAGGDLTARADVHSKDELGHMAEDLSKAMSAVQDTVRTLAESATALGSQAAELNAVSNDIAGSASVASNEVNVVSAAAEQVSRNVQTVATGAEQMGASIREIAQNAADAARVAASAVDAAQAANDTVSQLGRSSQEIGAVLKVITSIAEQTNLLALNATIEAARAGEAGKGFAVVANEVKDLAQETAKATEDISRRINAIQADTQGAVDAIGEIASVIGRINDYQSTIASAVEEQTATTNEMSRSVAEAAIGSTEIAGSITGVATAADSTTAGVVIAQAAAAELDRMSGELTRLVGQFTV